MPCRLGLNRAGTWLLVPFGVRVHQSRSPAASMSSKRPVDRWIHLITPHHKVVPRPQNPATPNPIARIPLPFFSALVSSPTALKFCQGAMFPPLPGLPKLDKLLLQLLSQAIASAEGLVFSLPSCFTRTTTATPMVKSSLAAAPRQSRRPSSARGAAHPNCPFQRPPGCSPHRSHSRRRPPAWWARWARWARGARLRLGTAWLTLGTTCVCLRAWWLARPLRSRSAISYQA